MCYISESKDISSFFHAVHDNKVHDDDADSLTWGRRALSEPLEGVTEEQLVAPTARAD